MSNDTKRNAVQESPANSLTASELTVLAACADWHLGMPDNAQQLLTELATHYKAEEEASCRPKAA